MGARTGRALHFSPDALRALLAYDWPGNVRELENALEFAATVSSGQTLQPEDLPEEVLAASHRREEPSPPAWRPPAPGAPPPLVEERAALEAALDAHRWSRAETAKSLGLSRSTLWRRMRALELT